MSGRTARDSILLTGVSARGFHGVLAAEREQGQEFVVDLVLEVDLREAGASDDLADTVDYAAVAADVVAIVEGPPADLVETVAARVASSALTRERVEAVEVTLHKPEAPVGVPFTDVAVRVRRERSLPVVIALGGNQGSTDQVAARLASAVRELQAVDGLTAGQVSRLFATAPVGGPPQPDYLNAVLVASTRLAPRSLLCALQGIEERHGRQRQVRWGPRTLDLDLVQYGDPAAGTDLVRSGEDLTLPHPRAAGRPFVLAPWLDADPSATLRVDGTAVPVAELLAALPPDDDAVRPGPDWSPLGDAGCGDAGCGSRAMVNRRW